VAVSSSNAPRFHVNPNTGGPLYVDTAPPVVADQTVYHGVSHPSYLELPVVPLPNP
jgi:predicted acyl esterase